MYELTIQNFQIIANASLRFYPGVTLITGKSNNGKTSIFKAFKQLVYNQPGTDYIKHGASHSTISLTTPDCHKIVYYKSKKDSRVSIDSKDPLNKLGAQQVPEVADVLHIQKDLDYNFWNQMDKPFLISLSNREQFDLLQQSPHTETLQNVLQSIVSDRKSLQQAQISNQSKLEIIQQQNQQFKSHLKMLPQYQKLFDSVQALKSQKDQIQNTISIYNKFQSIDLEPLKNKINNLNQIPNATKLQEVFNKLQSTQSLYQKLVQTQFPIQELHNSISQISSQIDRTKLFQSQYFNTCPLCGQPFHIHN